MIFAYIVLPVLLVAIGTPIFLVFLTVVAVAERDKNLARAVSTQRAGEHGGEGRVGVPVAVHIAAAGHGNTHDAASHRPVHSLDPTLVGIDVGQVGDRDRLRERRPDPEVPAPSARLLGEPRAGHRELAR